MTLLREIVEATSRADWAQHVAMTRGMPLHVLARACELNPALSARADRLGRLYEHLLARNEPLQLWRNSDLYAPLFNLSEAGNDSARMDRLIDLAEVHSGARPVEELPHPSDGFYRLARSRGSVVERRDGAWRTCRRDATATLDGFDPLVYLPRAGLFADLVPEAQYRSSAQGAGAQTLLDRLEAGYRLLADADPDLLADLETVVSTVVLLPPLGDEPVSTAAQRSAPDRLRWSFNLRLRYFGGVFLDLHRVDVFGAAEGLVHEYTHQRLWQWWDTELPSGIPPITDTMISPITGNRRAVCVMIHALVVYVTACRLYRAVAASAERRAASDGDLGSASTNGTGALSEWAGRRWAVLDAAVPRLYHDLRERVEVGTQIGTMIDLAMTGHRPKSGSA
jgi:hypothetical protein